MAALKSIQYTFARYLLRRPFMEAYVPEHRLRIKFKTEDALGRHMFKRAEYEPHLTNFVCKNVKLKAGEHAIDIGANLGWYSLLMDTMSEPGASIHAFEPDVLNYELLEHNLNKNEARNIKTNQIALSDKDGESVLHLYENKNRGRHSLLPINEGEKINVKTTSLDTYLKSRDISGSAVTFIKIDIEGFEQVALKGASQTLSQRPMILSEFVPDYIKNGGLSADDYIDYMFGFGYMAFLLTETGAEEVGADYLRSASGALDILWSSEEVNWKPN